MFLFFLILILLALLFNSTVFQTWAAKQAATWLSEKLHTTVAIDRLEVDITQRIFLQHFYVEDLNGDTLLFAGALEVGLDKGLFTLFDNELIVDYISLQNAVFNLHKDQESSNIARLFAANDQKDKNKEQGNPLQLNLKRIALQDVSFEEYNAYWGNRLNIHVDDGYIDVKKFNLQSKELHFSKMVARHPVVTRYEEMSPGLEALLASDSLSLEEVYPESLLPFDLKVDKILFTDGAFKLDNFKWSKEREKPLDQLDYKHLDVKNITFDIDSFQIKNWDFSGRINEISGFENSGLVINYLKVNKALVSPTGIFLYDMSLKTPESMIGDTLLFRYETYQDFKDFVNKVRLDLDINSSTLAVKDIMTFATPLLDNTFFVKNKDKVLRLSGQVKGPVNSLKGKNVKISIDNELSLEGEIAIRDVTDRHNEYLTVKLNRFFSHIRTLQNLLPQKKLPASFNNLGWINFKGSFTGFFQDFVADGVLSTSIGKASMDMRLDLKKGKEKAVYGGDFSLTDFDLGAFFNQPDIGKITLSSQIKDGTGLTLETAFANFNARIEGFFLKEYHYKNATIEGLLAKDSFKGVLDIKDENIDLSFIGELKGLQDSVPFYDFNARIARLDLQSLHLNPGPLLLSGDFSVTMQNKRLVDLIGVADIKNLILTDGIHRFELPNLEAVSQQQPNGTRFLDLRSDALNAYLVGQFDLQQLPAAIMSYFWSNFPEWSARFSIWNPQRPIKPTSFRFNFEVPDSKNLLKLLKLPFDSLAQSTLMGSFNNFTDSIEWDLVIPEVQIGPLQLHQINTKMSGKGGNMRLEDLSIGKVKFENKDSLFQLTTAGNLQRDTLFYDLSTAMPGTDSILMHLNGKVFQTKDLFHFSFSPKELILFNKKWTIKKDNFIQFGKSSFNAKNILLEGEDDKQISLKQRGTAGLSLMATNINFDFINDWWQYKPLQFSGLFNFFLDVENLYKLIGLEMVVESQSLVINKDDWGAMRLDVQMEDLSQPVSAYLSVTSPVESRQVLVEGKYFPPFQWHSDTLKNTLEASVSFSRLPLQVAEYFIKDLISDTKGEVNALVKLEGTVARPNISGEINILDAATTVNYLQTRYFFDNSHVVVDNSKFDATGTIIKDKEGNEGIITGGIVHEKLREFGLDVQMYAPKLIALDTDKDDNEDFYGFGIGEVDLAFSGSFQQTELRVSATSAKGTRIVIPVSGTTEANPINFIRFVNPKEKQDSAFSAEAPILRGMNLDLELSVTREAQISMIFDEEAGDIIRATGNGNIQLDITRTGEFNMYGDYQVEEGEYLFTLYNLVNKPFKVKTGGSNYIRWSGDPYNASIDIDAAYSGLSTSLTNFLLEYLEEAPAEVVEAAKNPTQVSLIMHLKGSLLRPDISFDIAFPDLIGELKRLADSKIEILKRDPNELNRQVFGLIVVGSFLPATGDTGGGSSNYLTTGINTLSELLSNQLSIYLTELLSEVFTDVSFISGVDFDIAYNVYDRTELYDSPNPQALQGRGSEIQLQQKLFLADDRISVNVGGNFTDANLSTQGVFVTHNIAVEIMLTDDRRYKFRFYNRSEPRLGGGFQTRTGAGFAYRREFDSFRDLVGTIDKYKRKLGRK